MTFISQWEPTGAAKEEHYKRKQMNPIYEALVEKRELRTRVFRLLNAGNEIITVTPFEFHPEWLTVQRYLILYRKTS